MAAESPLLQRVRPNGLADTPSYRLLLDHEKAKALGVPPAAVNQLLSVAWGSRYINDFLHNGRVKRVYQADASYRMLPEDVDHWYLRNADGEMTPLSELLSGRWDIALPVWNDSMECRRDKSRRAAPGYSSGGRWRNGRSPSCPPVSTTSGAAVLPGASGRCTAPLLYAVSILVVFLALAALYESWTVPLAVMLAVPLGILGAVLAAMLRGLPNDVFFQVGILTTIGVTARNAILLVEFARTLEAEGMSLIDATSEAARVRLRPILMTSAAFTMGVLPLAFATGAGATARVAIGTAVLGGMLSATLLATLFIPLFYIAVRRSTDALAALARRSRGAAGEAGRP